MTANMTVKTFEDTLREAQELGFETCRDTQTGITRQIDTLLSALESGTYIKQSNGYRLCGYQIKEPDGYILFGHYIARAADAWDRNAAVYFLN